VVKPTPAFARPQGGSVGRHAPLLVLALVVGAASLAACGTTDGSSSAGTTETTAEPTTTTSLPPGGRQPTPEDPLRVVFAGDSVMGNLAPATIAALNGGGSVDARFVLTPSVARDATVQVLWQQQIDEFDPDVIVMLIGTWENAAEGGAPGSPGWREFYEPNILDPFIQLVTSGGAKVIWIGMPAVDDPERTWQFVALNQGYATLPQRYPDQVQFVDGGAAVSSPEGGYVEVLNIPGVGELRLRRTDGTHLCPDGAVLIARPTLDLIVHDWNVPLLPDWEYAPWRLPENTEKPEECPGIENPVVPPTTTPTTTPAAPAEPAGGTATTVPVEAAAP